MFSASGTFDKKKQIKINEAGKNNKKTNLYKTCFYRKHKQHN
jgi:hypothetical protein